MESIAPEQVLLLSAATQADLGRYAAALARRLDGQSAGRRPAAEVMADAAYTLQVGRTSMAHRLAVTATDPAAALDALRAFAAGRPAPGIAKGSAAGPLARQGASAPATFPEAVRAWLAGLDVDWSTWWHARRPRLSLPGPPTWSTPDPHPGPGPQPGLAPQPELGAAQQQAEAAEAIAGRLVGLWGEMSGIDPGTFTADTPLEDLGLSSFLITRMNARLEADLGERDRTLFFSHRNLAGVAATLASRHPGRWRAFTAEAPSGESAATAPDGQPPVLPTTKGTATTTDPAKKREAVRQDGIAIIGMAGRLPGARTLQEYWENLRSGRDCVTRVPEDRTEPGWPADLMWGGFLDGVADFDPLLFGITPRDAELMDPQERLFLEVAWECLEDAGYTRGRLRERHGGQVGVFAGAMHNEYPYFGVERSLAGSPIDTGATLAGIANRASFFLDLHGPSLSVDTMCSSSLTAIHLAIQSLRRGEVEAAIVGATNLSLHPNKYIQQRRMSLAATEHHCRSFGAGGDGFVPAEAVLAIMLKPLEAAVRDGDRVHAVIAGSAAVHAGRTNGYLVPNPVAQGDMVARAWRDAGLDPADAGYLEAHGAGTALGDPVEITGLLRVFGSAGLPPGSVPIGSVKSCIGHAESAAGLAAMLKVVLQIRYGQFAPSLHAQQLNPDIDWDTVPFRVQREHAPWERRDDRPRRAGISSFGAGGALAHVVVEEFTAAPALVAAEPDGQRQLVVLSGRDEQALQRVVRRLCAALRDLDRPPSSTERASGQLPQPSLADIAYTLQVGREPLRERLAIVAGTITEVVAALERYLGDDAGAVLLGSAGHRPVAAQTRAETRAWALDADLDELARWWVTGGAVDWEARGTRPPRQIVDLPHYPFEALRCWVPVTTTVRTSADPARGGREEVPPTPGRLPVPLYEHGWVPDGPVPQPARLAGRVLCVFSRHSEPVARALRAVTGEGMTLMCEGDVRAGGHDGFVTASDAVRLVRQARDEGTPVTGWIDIADLHRPAAEAGLWRARMAALQELVGRGAGGDVRVLHVRSGVPAGPDGQSTHGCPANVVSGIVSALAAEGSVAAARSLVLDVPPGAPGQAAGQILGEWGTDSPYPRACHRLGQRYRPALLPAGPPTRSFAVSPTASYVVTGGTRGVGARVARWLVDCGARRLALSGRTDLDEGQRAAVRALRAAGAEVLVHVGSVADRAAMGVFLNRVRAELGPIGGVVHCAGRSDDPGAFAAKDLAEGGAASLVLEPKVEGLQALAEVLADDHPAFAVLFSSICAVAPSLARGVAVYAAANGYLESAAGDGTRLGDRPVQSVAWPQWSQAGGAAGTGNVCAALGIGTLTDEAGLGVLAEVIARPGLRSAVPLPSAGHLDLDAIVAVAPAASTVPAAPVPAGSGAGTEASAARAAGQPVPGWLADIFAAALHLPAARLDHDADFNDLGVESILLGELLRAIEGHLDRRLNPGLLLDYPTLRSLTGALAAECGHDAVFGAESAPPVPEPAPVSAATAVSGSRSGRVAIIGAACRFPDAPDLEAFWDNLIQGRSAVHEVPASRWDHEAYYRPRRQQGFSISKWGGFVDGIEDFDPEAFGMDEDEGRALDPAVRLTLETTQACLADAGYPTDELAGRPVGVFVGARMSRYGDRAGVRAHGLRSDQNFITAYAAQHFDLRGPNMVVDSACSSSLVSLQLAMRSLRDGECEAAIAGGVEVLLDETDYIDLSAAGALSPSGRCATFDQSADGFVPGEGCGLVMLKPLETALADGDRIRAVIDAIAVNNDGRTMGVTTPSREGQQRVVRQALASADRVPTEVGLLEAHGTGTLIGDPIELDALTRVFAPDGATASRPWCAIGSVKSNIGHLLSAAGIAGVLKAMLAIERGEIPATLWCERPNPRYNFSRSPFFLSTATRGWGVPPGARVAGVSSFGLGGTNAHAVLSGIEEAARPRPATRSPLPAPTFNRRRLWYDRDTAPAGEQTARPGSVSSPEETHVVASLLDLELVGGQR